MAAGIDTLQRTTKLTPLAEVLSQIGALAPLAPAQLVPVASAAGATLAADVVAPANVPERPTALNNGWAVASDQIIGASAYSPAALESAPLWVDAGQEMPADTDAVLPADALADNGMEVQESVAHGEGVLSAAADAAAGSVLRKAGEQIRLVDVAVLRALKIETVSVRIPEIGVVSLSGTGVKNDSAILMIADLVRAAGGMPHVVDTHTLDAALANTNFSAIIGIGGTGAGRNDNAVSSLARLGTVACHGVGVSLGRTAALGSANGRVVLLLPGRLDAALAVFLILGRKLVARLTGAASDLETEVPLSLSKKVTSTIGLAEAIFVSRAGQTVEPLGKGVFSLEALSRADGWILVPPASEGFAAGTMVVMRSLQ